MLRVPPWSTLSVAGMRHGIGATATDDGEGGGDGDGDEADAGALALGDVSADGDVNPVALGTAPAVVLVQADKATIARAPNQRMRAQI